jgi:hypothetical protein
MSHSSKKKEKNVIKHKSKKEPSRDEPCTTIIAKHETLMTFLNAIESCDTECILNISDEKLSVRMVDIGNVYMLSAECDCKISKEKGSPDKIAIDSKILKKLLVFSKGCGITLTITESIIKAAYGRFTTKTSPVDMTLMKKEPNRPTITLDTSFSIPGKYLNEISKAISKEGKIYVYVKNKVVFLAATEGDICIQEVVGTMEKDSKARSLYSNDYIRSISNMIKDCECTIDVAIDHPIKINAEKNDCRFEFLLAPKIEAD